MCSGMSMPVCTVCRCVSVCVGVCRCVSVCVGVCRCVHAVGKREADIKQTSPESNRFVGTHHSSQLACNYRPCNVLLARAVVTSVHRTPRWLAPNWTRFRANLFHQHKTERPTGFGVNNSNECRRNRSNNKSDATIFLFLISFVFILFYLFFICLIFFFLKFSNKNNNSNRDDDGDDGDDTNNNNHHHQQCHQSLPASSWNKTTSDVAN